MAGSVEYVLVCRVGGTTGSIRGPASKCLMPDGTEGWPVLAQGYVLTADEYASIQKSAQYFSTCQTFGGCNGGGQSVFDTFTAADGAMLSGAVIACWCTAFGIRAIIDVIRGSTNEE